ncbi:MAG: trehalose-phosphatase [Xanthomonadales bacterium]|nr:trehalose-phosphatase [Xanthomonadales bacterium]
MFLDLDGTLVDFAERPDGVEVEPGLPPLLARLERHFDGALAPLSGRPLKEIDALLRRRGGAAGGSHGAEIRRADGVMLASTAHLAPELSRLETQARELATAVPGVLVETKPGGIALHYRGAPSAAGAVRDAADALLDAAGPGYMLQAGNHVIELKPAHSDKGAAVAALMATAPFAGRLPWVLGDDLTDEHAFEEAQRLGGVAIVVGPRRPSAASHALASPAAVRAWLSAVANACSSGAAA